MPSTHARFIYVCASKQFLPYGFWAPRVTERLSPHSMVAKYDSSISPYFGALAGLTEVWSYCHPHLQKRLVRSLQRQGYTCELYTEKKIKNLESKIRHAQKSIAGTCSQASIQSGEDATVDAHCYVTMLLLSITIKINRANVEQTHETLSRPQLDFIRLS